MKSQLRELKLLSEIELSEARGGESCEPLCEVQDFVVATANWVLAEIQQQP